MTQSEEPFNRESLDPDPVTQFSHWLQQAQTADMPYANAMSLSTAARSGEVSSRIVMLRYFDRRGFVFFSGYDTQKGGEIAENANVALLFPWLVLERQVRIRGTAVKISTKETLRFFSGRPKESQIGAWLTQSGAVVSSKGVLRAKLREIKEKFAEGSVALPALWGGYRVIPTRFEFWQGRANGLHDRFQYTCQADATWEIQRLAP